MELIILKTYIDSEIQVNTIRKIMLEEPKIKVWTIDLEDRDKVLRMEVKGLLELEIINKIRLNGIDCDVLK
ncbi:MAG: hypothetical protein ACPGSD_07455 [Flavobacteriales bacterium]